MTSLSDLPKSNALIVVAGDGARRMANRFRAMWCPSAIILADYRAARAIETLYEARSLSRTLSRPVILVVDGLAMHATKEAEHLADFFIYASEYEIDQKDFVCAIPKNGNAFTFGVRA